MDGCVTLCTPGMERSLCSIWPTIAARLRVERSAVAQQLQREQVVWIEAGIDTLQIEKAANINPSR